MASTNSLARKVHKLEDLHCLKSEMELRQELFQAIATERAKQDLSHAARTDDGELVDWLYKAGFTAETLPALSLSPIALVAWGSGYVTSEERAVAMQAVVNSEISGNESAIAKFQSWLDTRPCPDLLRLWADITKAQNRRLRPGTQGAIADQMLHMTNRVALASGGFLGFGAICAGEQAVIEYVSDVFQRPAA